MIFNQTGPKAGDLIIFKWDYGVPVNFAAGTEEGFEVGDKIIFRFVSDIIEPKVFTVNQGDYKLSLYFTKAEAETLAKTRKVAFQYTIKHYGIVENKHTYLNTLINGEVQIKGTLKWEPEEEENG